MDGSLNIMVQQVRDALHIQEPAPGSALEARYELFYHPNSICSQKVRAVLAHHNNAYTARIVNIATGETYLPSYVRLRLIGCRSVSDGLARSHTGSTSVSSSGCDALVVPTLVDWETNKVIVDSKRICLYLDTFHDESQKLRPASLTAQIDAELAIVDDFPNYQLRLGSPPDGRETPVMKKGVGGKGFGLSKVERCKLYIEEHRDEPALVEAYQAKLEKEQQAVDELLSAAAMRAVYDSVDSACHALEEKLKTSGATWLFAGKVTMADLFWAIQLLRIKNICADVFWKDGRLPMVQQYVHATASLPSIKKTVFVGAEGVY